MQEMMWNILQIAVTSGAARSLVGYLENLVEKGKENFSLRALTSTVLRAGLLGVGWHLTGLDVTASIGAGVLSDFGLAKAKHIFKNKK